MSNTSWDYRDARVIITGGTKGIGRVITEKYLAAGANVLTCARSTPETLPSAGGRTALFQQCDVRDLAQLEALVSRAVEEWGGLDILINNAGGSPHVDAATVSPRFNDSILALNLVAPMHLSQIANRQMQTQDNGGVIINIGSISGTRPSPGTAAYGAAKAGLSSLTGTLAVEWAPKVRVVEVTCGIIATETAEEHYGGAAGVEAVGQTIPAGRMGTPDEVAAACLFLGSNEASFITGSTLILHGGGEAPSFLAAAEKAQST